MSPATNSRHVKQHTVYKLKDGTRVPSVTTYLKVLDKSNYLVPWANKLGLAGVDSTKYRDEKARIGSLAHEMILSHLKKEEPDLYEYSQMEIDQAENCFLKYLSWEKQHTVDPILAEGQMVSEVFKFGGTVDFYGRIDGRLELGDFKTGNGIYPEMWYQLAGYGMLLEEHGHHVDARRIINIGRDETENFVESIKAGPPQEDEILIFRSCQAIYEARKRLKHD
jgi:hypothetical protein